ncbi:MAG: DUF2189 domain-containing protein [Ancalomicrobiaceae bacterium]|nr:DUF2189 domain-containing protein [Ancalomicrobiaceae bacterium]
MSDTQVSSPPAEATDRKAAFAIRAITVDDISEALTVGLRDFRAAPAYGLVFGIACTLFGILFVETVMRSGYDYVVYPAIAGFTFVAPLAAIGLYETSRRLERGDDVSWRAVLTSIFSHGGRELGFMSLVTMFGLLAWVYSAAILYALFFGLQPADAADIIANAVATPRGLAFLLVGNLVGAAMSLVLFSVSVVSYPMLIDRDIDFVTAITTSIQVVSKSPGPLIGWGIFIATMTGIAILPMFLGLVVVLPLLGHASWHLYRRAIVAGKG